VYACILTWKVELCHSSKLCARNYDPHRNEHWSTFIGYHHHWQNSPFWATAFLKRFCQICHLDLTSLNFITIIFSQSKVISLASNTQTLGPGLCIYIVQCQGGPVIFPPPQTPTSLSVTLYNPQGYGGHILTCLYMGFYWVSPNWGRGGGSHQLQHSCPYVTCIILGFFFLF
jgi:hypothetical protein